MARKRPPAPTGPLKVLAYGRVSTDKQTISPRKQEYLCREWFDQQLKHESFDRPAEYIGIAMDPAVSAKRPLFQRPKGQYILETLDRGDVLVVADFTRAFRSAADAEWAIDAFQDNEIRLVILNLNVDTSTPTGMLTVSILASVARFERELVKERTREALHQRRREGQWLGESPPPGYILRTKKQRNSRDNELVPDEAVRALGAYAARELASGTGIGDVVHEIQHGAKKDVPRTQRKSRWKNYQNNDTWISRDRVVAWAAYHLCGWPPVTRQELREMHGDEVFTVAFVRDHYTEVDQASGSKVPL